MTYFYIRNYGKINRFAEINFLHVPVTIQQLTVFLIRNMRESYLPLLFPQLLMFMLTHMFFLEIDGNDLKIMGMDTDCIIYSFERR